MGNNQSDATREFHENYAKAGDVEHPTRGHIQYYQNKTIPNDFVFLKEKVTEDPTESAEITNFIQNRISIKHPNLTPCVTHLQEDDNYWLSKKYVHSMAFGESNKNLEGEISNNKKESLNIKNYSEPEMWYLANSITNVDLTLSREGGAYHGDIQPANIGLTENGKTQIVDSALINMGKSSYSRMLFDKKVKAALSPELLDQLKEKKITPTCDASRQESWALGMTMLCAGTNSNLDDFYDWSVPCLKQSVLNERLNSLNGKYSPQMYSFVEGCLDQSEDRRTSMENHETYLRPYQREINNMTLDFKKTNVVKTSTKTTVVVPTTTKKTEYTKVVDNNDFLNNLTESLPAPARGDSRLNIDYDNFFEKPVTILKTYEGEFKF